MHCSTSVIGSLALSFLLMAGQCFAGWTEVLEATVQVRTNNAVGTGVVFQVDNGTVRILTNAHVIWRSQTCIVTFYDDGRIIGKPGGRVVWQSYNEVQGVDGPSPPRDLAIVEVSVADLPKAPPAIPIGTRADAPKPNDTVVSVGCAFGAWPTLFQGRLVEYDQDGTITFEPPPAQGRSGSAVFNQDGTKIVGLVAWAFPPKTPRYGGAVSLNEIIDAMSGKEPAAVLPSRERTEATMPVTEDEVAKARAKNRDWLNQRFSARPPYRTYDELLKWSYLLKQEQNLDRNVYEVADMLRRGWQPPKDWEDMQCGPGGCGPGGCGPGGCPRPYTSPPGLPTQGSSSGPYVPWIPSEPVEPIPPNVVPQPLSPDEILEGLPPVDPSTPVDPAPETPPPQTPDIESGGLMSGFDLSDIILAVLAATGVTGGLPLAAKFVGKRYLVPFVANHVTELLQQRFPGLFGLPTQVQPTKVTVAALPGVENFNQRFSFESALQSYLQANPGQEEVVNKLRQIAAQQ